MGIVAGDETRVNTHTNDSQSSQQVGALTGGGWVVTWTSYAQDGSQGGVYQQVYDSTGAPVGIETRVNVYTTGDQGVAKVAALDGGGWVVTWLSLGQDEAGGYGIYQQAYAANGTASGGEVRVNTYVTNAQSEQEVTSLDGGGWVVTWASWLQDGSGYGVYQQAYDAAGAPIGSETRVNTYVTSDQKWQHIAALDGGGWVVAWTSIGQDGNQSGVYQQAFDANGAAVGSEARVNTHVMGPQSEPQIVTLDNGGWVVAWTSLGQDGSNNGVYQQRYDASGAPVGAEARVNAYTTDDQGLMHMVGLDGGGWVVIWRSTGQELGFGNGFGVYQQAYDANGVAIGGETRVNTYIDNHQAGPHATALEGGGWVVTWHSENQDGSGYGIHQQIYDATGTAVGEETRVNEFTAGNQWLPQITTVQHGWVVTWTSDGQDGLSNGVYQKFFHLTGGSMAIDFTGIEGTDYSFDDISGVYELGSVGYDRNSGNPIAGTPGLATATLDDGSTETLFSTHATFDPLLLIGVGNDGTDASNGTMTITADSTLILQGAGKLGAFATEAQIGTMGGTGVLNVTAGGVFRIVDPLHGNLIADNFLGVEAANVGDGQDSIGTVLVSGNNSKFEIIGGLGYLGIGRNGGTGTFTVNDGAAVLLHDTTNDPKDDDDNDGTAEDDVSSRSGTQIGVGSNTDAETIGTGTLDIDDASMTITSDNGGAFFEVGVGGSLGDGHGTVNLTNGAALTLNGGSNFAFVGIGNGANGRGELNATDSTITLNATSGFAGMKIAENGAFGEATVTNTVIGITTGDGGAELAVADGDFANDNVADGVALFDAGTTVEVTGSEWTGLVVGRGENARGTLTFDNSSSLTINGASENGQEYGVYAEIGREGGNGTVTFEDGSSLEMTSIASDSRASMDIGWNGGTGRLNLRSNAEAAITGVAGAGLNVGGKWDDFGGDPGVGDLDVNAAELSVKATAGDVQTQIGYGNGGDGEAIFDNATFTMDTDGAGNRTNLVVGWNGGLGEAEFRNGTQVTLSSDFNTNLEVGGEWNDDDGDGGTGTVTIDGATTLFTMTAGGDDGVFIGIGRDGGTGTLNVTGGADLVATSTDADANTNLMIGATKLDRDPGNGTVTVTGVGSQLFLRQAGPKAGSVHVGGNEGGDGLLRVLAGGRLELSADAQKRGVLRIGAEEGGTAEVEVSGTNSIITNLHYVSIGFRNDPNDPDNEAGRAGSLRVSNGGTFSANGTDGFIGFGQGGTLRGGSGNGTLIGEVEFTGGGAINMQDGVFGSLTFEDRVSMQGNIVTSVRLDVGAAANDQLFFNGEFQGNSDVGINLAAVGGFKFTKGQTKTLVTFSSEPGGNGDVSLTVGGQQTDFSYYFGRLTTLAGKFVVVALNNGNAASAANAGVLDYGTTGAGKLVYNSLTQNGTVTGGKFGADGGFAIKLDDVRGTNGVDNFSVTGTTARTLKFDGKGGNDIIKGGAGVDTILGGLGNDTLTGNAGNDILQGDVGKDTMTGSAGNDMFKFTLKTHSSASHANADVIMDFDDPGKGNDRIDVSGLMGPKMSYIGATAFTKAGQVRIKDVGADLIVEVNLTGTSGTDFAIRLKSTAPSQVGLDDFVL